MSARKSVNNHVDNMLATLDTINAQTQHLTDESRSQETAAASMTQRLFALDAELLQTEAEHQALEQQMAEFANNDEQLLDILMERFHKLGCNLFVSRDDRTLYRIGYTTNRHLLLRVEDGQLSLLQMSPVHPNFASIQEFFSESQDLIGLLTTFGNA
ncbi:hypothetical protein KR044_006084 [Drosophila immigrans]|nr:hypothetical protein KR044_006084 [Drosophila immigrans]